MAGININSIMKKVKAYAKDDEGKKRMDQRVNELRLGKNGKTDGGDYVATIEDMNTAAFDMEAEAKNVAKSHRLPDSILDHFDSLRHGAPYYDKALERYRVDIYFEDNLYRPSLEINDGPMKGQRTGDGIDNIVSLFDTGYVAHGQVFGLWRGHESRGVIPSLMYRKPLRFMEEAVEDFNRTHFYKKYHVTAILPDSGDDIQFYSR